MEQDLGAQRTEAMLFVARFNHERAVELDEQAGKPPRHSVVRESAARLVAQTIVALRGQK